VTRRNRHMSCRVGVRKLHEKGVAAVAECLDSSVQSGAKPNGRASGVAVSLEVSNDTRGR
jgi:hypothetical protein